jgi:hypothetical protein
MHSLDISYKEEERKFAMPVIIEKLLEILY